MADKIQDFGEKIGGARKDLAALDRSLTVDDIADWTDIERKEFITKKQLWKAPDYQAMVDGGLPVKAAFFIKCVHDALPAKPASNSEEYQNGYINFVGDIREHAMNIKTMQDVKDFFNDTINGKYANKLYGSYYRPTKNAYDCFTIKFLRACTMSEYNLQRGITEKMFLFSDDEKLLAPYKFITYDGANVTKETYEEHHYNSSCQKERLIFSQGNAKYYVYQYEPQIADMQQWKPNTVFVFKNDRKIIGNNFENIQAAKEFVLNLEKKKEPIEHETKSRKHKFTPPQLAQIKREGGQNYRQNMDITGEHMLEDFCFKGGEFGNWESQNDRQMNLNMSYDAFQDLAAALEIEPEYVSLGGELSIAYGARGHSSALAHFEPARNVINLTKMRGAGSLAHEWGHALDFYIAREMQVKTQTGFATEEKYNNSILSPVIRAMNYTTNENGVSRTSDYLKESKEADQTYSKEDKGYWSSNVEMFARAFACYVHDKLAEKGIRSDFLCGHSESSVYPKGKERKAINAAIDKVIDKLKSMGLLLSAEVTFQKSPAEQDFQSAPVEKIGNVLPYSIYQLKSGDDYHGIRFSSFEENKSEDLTRKDYEFVYTGKIEVDYGENVLDTLEEIYEKFNTERPKDFKEHSLSVSDVVTIDSNDNEKAYYVDNVGFKEFSNFFREEQDKEKTAKKHVNVERD